ncbi:RDD family protein [Candidatus Woesearchaeota archaeon]|nr:RDD family protein [Candidatus Woesearchaeota archaeon]
MRLKKSELNKLLGKNDIAPFWKRLIAYVLDSLIINLIIVLPFKGILDNVYKGNLFKMGFNDIKSAILIITIMSFLTLLYWVLLEYRTQQTIGKYLMNIYVMSTSKKFSFLQIVIRNIAKISAPLLILDVVYMFYNNNQRYTEKLSETKVMER